MTPARERTLYAKGTKCKSGATCRIALTMDTLLFARLRGRAVKEGRSISDMAVRLIKDGLDREQRQKASVAA